MHNSRSFGHNDRMFDWDDLRYFLAVARHGSTIAAGKALRTSQTTVQRRLTALEARIGRRLVMRHATGYRLTSFGEELRPYAEQVEAAVAVLAQRVDDTERASNGIIRVTCPGEIIQRMMPLVERFHSRYPKLRVEFVMSDRYLDLGKGEADVAFRSGDTEDELVGRKIADSIWAVYASRDYIRRFGKPASIEDLTRHPLVSLDEALSDHRVVKWVKQVAPGVKLTARNDSVAGIFSAVKSGVGVGPLPTAIADADSHLVRVLGPIPELGRSWRLLTHPDLRRTPRISTFFDFIGAEREFVKSIFGQ